MRASPLRGGTISFSFYPPSPSGPPERGVGGESDQRTPARRAMAPLRGPERAAIGVAGGTISGAPLPKGLPQHATGSEGSADHPALPGGHRKQCRRVSGDHQRGRSGPRPARVIVTWKGPDPCSGAGGAKRWDSAAPRARSRHRDAPCGIVEPQSFSAASSPSAIIPGWPPYSFDRICPARPNVSVMALNGTRDLCQKPCTVVQSSIRQQHFQSCRPVFAQNAR